METHALPSDVCDGKLTGFTSSPAWDHRPDISEYERWLYSFGSNRKCFYFPFIGADKWFHSWVLLSPLIDAVIY